MRRSQVVGLPSFRKTKSGVIVTWGNLSTLVLWVQWDLVVAMMARDPLTDGEAEQVRDPFDGVEDKLAVENAERLRGIVLSAEPSSVADLVVGALEDEAGYTTEETTHSG